MACGLPIISSDCKSGPREIIAPDTDINEESNKVQYEEYGILVPTCDGKMYKYDDKFTENEEYLYLSIINTLTNKDVLDKYAAKSLKRVEDFSIKNIIVDYIIKLVT